MTDKTPLDERYDLIRENFIRIANGIGTALEGNREPTTREAAEALEGVLVLAQITITAINEIAYNVGRLATVAERDLSAEVDKAAEAKANDKVAGKLKRSFIGMKNNP